MSSTTSNDILSIWKKCNAFPGGKHLFSFIMGRRVPYSHSIGAKIECLKPGYSQILMRDRRKVRNHLNSIHAIALVNLGEMACGLALLCGLQKNARGIVTKIEIEYFKKARGDLIAEGHAIIPDVTEKIDHVVEASIFDSDKIQVAKVSVKWQLGLKEN